LIAHKPLGEHIVIRVDVDLAVLEPQAEVPAPLRTPVDEVLGLDSRLAATDLSHRVAQLNQAIKDTRSIGIDCHRYEVVQAGF